MTFTDFLSFFKPIFARNRTFFTNSACDTLFFFHFVSCQSKSRQDKAKVHAVAEHLQVLISK
jgi:hypothetical protein